jgi:hypothetical protein
MLLRAVQVETETRKITATTTVMEIAMTIPIREIKEIREITMISTR